MAFIQGNYAELTNRRYGLTRQELDEFCVSSYERAGKAWQSGELAEEVVPVEIQTKKGTATVLD